MALAYTVTTRGSIRRADASKIQTAANRAAANALVLAFKDNFISRGGRKYYGRAARLTTATKADPYGVAVEVHQRGIALHYHGGTVKATGRRSEVTGKPTKALLIPSKRSPLYLRDRSLAELGIPRENVHVIKAKNGKAYLVADTARAAKAKAAGKQPMGKKGKKVKGRDRLVFLGSLRKSATIRADKSVIPSHPAMLEAVRRGAEEAIKSYQFYNN